MQNWRARSRYGVVAMAISGVLAGPSVTQAPGADPLAQQCIAPALKKPTGVKVSVRYAGHNSGRHQASVLTAQWAAMPEACLGKYDRDSQAKSQVFRNGKWARLNDFEPIAGVYQPGGNIFDPQAAFAGIYWGTAVVTPDDLPSLVTPCRVRILLKEALTRHRTYADSGYHPTHNVAQRVYTFPVPIRRIWPHKGESCKLLIPHRYPQGTRIS